MLNVHILTVLLERKTSITISRKEAVHNRETKTNRDKHSYTQDGRKRKKQRRRQLQETTMLKSVDFEVSLYA